jgi:hypothetical protein
MSVKGRVVANARLESMVCPDCVGWRKNDPAVLRPESEHPLLDCISDHFREGPDAIGADETVLNGGTKDSVGLSVQEMSARRIVFKTNDKIDDFGNGRRHSQDGDTMGR